MNYEQAKQHRDEIEKRISDASNALKKYPRGEMGITPDDVKASPEFQADRATLSDAFAELRKFNTYFLREFKKEVREERKNRPS